MGSRCPSSPSSLSFSSSPSFSSSRLLVCIALAAAGLLLSGRAEAQRRPQAGGVSLWGELGVAVPGESRISSTLGIAGGIDYFVTRALSVGALVGGWKGDTDLNADDSEAYLTGIATYNWEMGKFHPFVQVGLGGYRVDPPRGDAETNFGGFAGGGLDYFIRSSLAVEGVARYHVAPSVAGFEGRFLEVLGGLKLYF